MSDINPSIDVTTPSQNGVSITVSTSQQDSVGIIASPTEIDVNASSPNYVPLNATPDLSMYYSEVSENYAKQAEDSAERAAESAKNANDIANSILNNENIQTIVNNLDIIEATPENAQLAKEQAELAQGFANSAGESATIASQQATIATEKAQEASNNAEIVLAKIDVAQTAASNANTSATSALNSANLAQTYMQNAQASASNAKTSETNAKTSENSAKSAATTATAKANEASASANNAQASANTATAQATIATQQANIAKQEVAKLANVYNFKGSVATYANLPTNASVGDVYDVQENGANYAWTGSVWDSLGGVFKTTTEWGELQGTLSNQTDLKSALDGKQDALIAGGNITIEGNVISAIVPEVDAYTKSETDALLDNKQDTLTPNAPIELSKVVLSNSYGYTYQDDGSMLPTTKARWDNKSVNGQLTITATLPYSIYIDFPLNLDSANNKFVMYPELMTTSGAVSYLLQALGKLDADGNFYPIIILNPVGDDYNANSSRYFLASSLATNDVPVTLTTKKGSSATSATSSYLATGDSLNTYVVAFGFQKTSDSQINISSVRRTYNWTVTVNSSLINEINCFRVLHQTSGVSGTVKPQFIGLFQGSSTVATNGTTLREDVKKALDGELTSEIDVASFTTVHQVKLNHDNTLKVVNGALSANLDDYALKSDIPNVSNFITMSDVEAKKYLTSVPSEYVTDTELTSKGYLVASDISGKADTTTVNNQLALKADKSDTYTKAEVDDKIADAVTGGEIDLSGYAKTTDVDNKLSLKADKTEIPNVSNFITMSDVESKKYLTSVPSEYVTETELNAKGYLTEHQDISNLATKAEVNAKQDKGDYALKSELPNTSSFITMADVEAKKYLTSVPSEYVTDTELNAKGYLTQHQDISNLATKTEVQAKQDKLTAGKNIAIKDGVISAEGGVSIDNNSITENSLGEIQAVAVIDNNTSNAIKTWTGTRAEYDAIEYKDSTTLYNITDDNDITLSLLDILYPVGAVYIGTMATCPLEVLGVGSWQLIASDRVLQGAGTYEVKSTVEAGLPNITGSYGNTYLRANSDDATGACYGTYSTAQAFAGNSGTSLNRLMFDASRSNSIYGNSDTVQSPAYIVNIWERIL